MKRAFIALIVGGALLIGGTAGFGGSHTKSSITLSADAGARSTELRIGSTASFDIVTPYWYTDGRGPWVIVRCFQGGQQVLFAGQGYWNGATQFVLGPTQDWQSGAATCTADLGHYTKLGGKFSVEASTTFDVTG
jgi:hypothetical protein